MQQKTAALPGTYCISFKSSLGTLRYMLQIDSTSGMFFYGKMESDPRYITKRRDFCYIKGIVTPGKRYDFIMKPDLQNGLPYELPCSPYEWLLNNKVYFSFREEGIISGYMVVRNEFSTPNFSFSGMKQALPQDGYLTRKD
ncbi:hypothetical protein ACQKLP_07925 [Chitinophaga sp. NPDC101104]|uniref:hypothetical protein n=1 Tax=Chitinophaga sp. NPDC101104 TaxID=3390561 RepID=UPI003D09538D